MENTLKELVIGLEDERCRAMKEGNAPRLFDLLSEDLYYGHSGGYWDNKTDLIAKIADGRYNYDDIKTTIKNVVAVEENTLVINGTVVISVKLFGVQKMMESIYLAVWQKKPSGWQFLAHQTALLPSGDNL
jgi:hypothetical protein